MPTVSRGGHDGAPQSRPNLLLDPTRQPDGYVPILCTEHGRFVAWCWPPAPSSTVGCPPSCITPAAADDAPGPTEHPCECDLPDRPGSCALCQARAAALDPDDTSRCPTWPGCDTCGALDDLAVAVAETYVGIACLTLCGSCADAGDLPRWPVLAAYARVASHAAHLGTDVDTLAAASRRTPNPGGAL